MSAADVSPEFPEEGSLAHVEPIELVERLGGLSFTGRLVFYVGAVEGEIGFFEGGVVDARALGDELTVCFASADALWAHKKRRSSLPDEHKKVILESR